MIELRNATPQQRALIVNALTEKAQGDMKTAQAIYPEGDRTRQTLSLQAVEAATIAAALEESVSI
jgi:hypothetical protein